MEKAKIIFKDGSEIEAEVNGGSLIVDKKPDFPADLSTVTVEDGQGERTYNNAELVECASVDGRYWFTFVEQSETERRFAEIEDALCDLSKE